MGEPKVLIEGAAAPQYRFYRQTISALEEDGVAGAEVGTHTLVKLSVVALTRGRQP